MGTIRSTFTQDGQRLFLDECAAGFQLQTRWYRIGKPIEGIYEAIDAFEALELMEGDLRTAFRMGVRPEMERLPRCRCIGGRVLALVEGAEKRLLGLRPQACGSKQSLTKWVNN